MSELFTSKAKDSNKLISYFYAAFTTSKTTVTASAICMFTMDQIMGSFHSDYKQKQTLLKVPTPRPSECPRKLTYQHLVFSRKNILMENEISSEALVIETSRNSRFVSIDVDFGVTNYQNKVTSDVLFVGTGK